MEFRSTNVQETYEVRNGADHLMGWVVRTPNGKWHSVSYLGLDGLDHWGKTFATRDARAAYEQVIADYHPDSPFGHPSRERAALDWLDELSSTPLPPRSTPVRPRREQTPGQEVPSTAELMRLVHGDPWNQH